MAMVATSLKVDPRCRSETSGRRRGVPGRAARSRPVWKPAKDTQIPRRRTRRHHSRASDLAARRRDPWPIIEGHHGHHGHPSVKTLKKKILAARWVWVVLTSGHSPWIFFSTFLLGVAMVAMVATANHRADSPKTGWRIGVDTSRSTTHGAPVQRKHPSGRRSSDGRAVLDVFQCLMSRR